MVVNSFLIFLLLFMLLGFSIVYLFHKEILPLHLAEIPGLFFSLGLMQWSGVSFLGYVFSIPLVTALALSLALAFIFLLLGYFRYRNSDQPKLIKLSSTSYIVVWLIFLFAYFGFIVGASPHPTADTVHHLSFARKFYETGVFDIKFFQLSATIPQDVLFSAYAFNPVYPLYAVISYITGTDPYYLIRFGSGVVGAALISTLFSAGYRMTGRASVGVVSVICMLIYMYFEMYSRYGGIHIRSLSYPNQIAVLPVLVAVSLLWSSLKQSISSYYFICFLGFLSSTIMLIHIQWWAFLLFAISVMFFVFLLSADKIVTLKRLALYTLGLTLFTLIFAMFKFASYSINSSQLEGVNFNQTVVVGLFGGYMFNPLVMINVPHYIFLLIGVTYLWVFLNAGRQRVVDEGVYLSAVVLSIFIFLFNPFTVPIFTKLVSLPILGRMFLLLDFAGFILVSYFLVLKIWPLVNGSFSVDRYITNIHFRQKRMLEMTPAVFLLMAFTVFPHSGLSIEKYLDYDKKHSTSSGYGASMDEVYNSAELIQLLEQIPIGSNLLSHGELGAYGKSMELAFRHVYQTYPTYAFSDPEKELKMGIDKIFKLKTSEGYIKNHLSKLNVDYLLLWPGSDIELKLKFDGYTELFAKIKDVKIKSFHNDYHHFVLYSVKR